MTTYASAEFGEVQRVTRDGKKMLLLVCPGCGDLGTLDDDQAHGRVSVDHASDGCAGAPRVLATPAVTSRGNT